MKRHLIIAVVLLIMGGFLFWWFSPNQVLKRRTISMLETLTMDPGASRSVRQMGVYTLNALLAPEVELSSSDISEANGTFDRGDLESAYAWLANHARQTRFHAGRFESIAASGNEGEVVFMVDALVELSNHKPVDGRYLVNFRWQRGDDKNWQLTAATWSKH